MFPREIDSVLMLYRFDAKGDLVVYGPDKGKLVLDLLYDTGRLHLPEYCCWLTYRYRSNYNIIKIIVTNYSFYLLFQKEIAEYNC